MPAQDSEDPNIFKAYKSEIGIYSIAFSNQDKQVAYGCVDGSLQVEYLSSK